MNLRNPNPIIRFGHLAVVAVLFALFAGGCGVIRHRRPAKCSSGLPCYDGYGQHATIARVPGLTFTGIRLTEQPVPEEIVALARVAPAVDPDRLTTNRKRELKTLIQDAVENTFEMTPTPADELPLESLPSEIEPIPEPAVVDGMGNDADEAEAREQSIPPRREKTPVRVRYFSLADDALQNGHCRLSQVSVIIWSDGRWELFVRAEQNPPEPPNNSLAPSRRLQTSHIKRSEFHVVVKGFGAAQVADIVDGDRVAKPVLLHRSADPFWVERGQPKELTFSGKLDALQDFDLIKRFEVEFAYR